MKRERGQGRNGFHCYICRNELNAAGIYFNDVIATIRVFAGTAGYASLTGGFAACDQHRAEALEQAMRPLLDPPRNLSPYLSVTAYEVVEVDGEPQLGRRLFIAKQKMPQGAHGVVRARR